MAKSTVVPFDIPLEFSADPLTEVIQAGAKVDLSRFYSGPIALMLSGFPFESYGAFVAQGCTRPDHSH